MARSVFGQIDLDPASCKLAQKYIKAVSFFDCESDGLENEWAGRVWLNPPYSKDLCSRFAAKLLESLDADVSEAIVLVNNATETGWMQELLGRCSAACFPAGRIKFLDSTGKPANSPLQGQAFLYFGDKYDEFRVVFSSCGAVFFNARDIFEIADDRASQRQAIKDSESAELEAIATWIRKFQTFQNQSAALNKLFLSLDPQVMGLVRHLVEVVDD